MERLTENDRGNFLVETQGSTHLWEIRDSHGEVHVSVTRNSKRTNPYGLDSINGRPYTATVKVWPEVGGTFTTVINGGASDIPWTRSSRIKSITRIADEPVTIEDRRAMGDDMLYPTHNIFGEWEN